MASKKLVRNPKKGLTASLFPCILLQYQKNGIERPKGILQNCQNVKVCEKRRIYRVLQPFLWSAFANSLHPKTYGIGVVAFYGKGQARTKRQNDPYELLPNQRSDWYAQSDRDSEELVQLVPAGRSARSIPRHCRY